MQPVRRDEPDRFHRGEFQDLRDDLRRNRVVNIHNRERIPALARAMHGRSADVDTRITQRAGNMRKCSRQILLANDHAVELAGDVHVDAVDTHQFRCATANGNASRHHFVAISVYHAHFNRVGMADFGNRVWLENKVQAVASRQVERVANLQVVGMEPQQPRNKSPVGAMAVVRVRERPVQRERSLFRLSLKQVAHHAGNTQRARRMGRRGANHNGPNNVANAQRLHALLLAIQVNDNEQGYQPHPQGLAQQKPLAES